MVSMSRPRDDGFPASLLTVMKHWHRMVLLVGTVAAGGVLQSIVHAHAPSIIPAAVVAELAQGRVENNSAAVFKPTPIPKRPPQEIVSIKGEQLKREAPQGVAAKQEGEIADSALFTPNQFKAGNIEKYVNIPVNPETEETKVAAKKAFSRPIDEPYGLRHMATPPGKDVVMGLAAYPKNMGNWVRVVGSLRNSGYDGHIIFGVHKDIPKEEEDYLKKMDVTYYEVVFVDCDESIRNKGEGGNIRGKCSKGLEKLTLEWGRFEMARQWLYACEQCTGWALVMDTRDVFFQSHPFSSLPAAEEAKVELLFIEEVGKHTSPKPEKNRWYDLGDNRRYKDRTEACYGKDHWKEYGDRPVLCSGTVIGNRVGMLRFLSVLVDEFYSNNAKDNVKCKSPHATDQWTMNYMYYNGKFGEYDKTKTMPWGTGPVMTIGHPCINTDLTPDHSQKDMIEFDNKMYILNNHEEDGSKARVPPVVHQYDRCAKWINPWFNVHPELFKNLPELPWKRT